MKQMYAKSQELRRSILRTVNEDVTYLSRKRSQLFDTEFCNRESVYRFGDFIGQLTQKYKKFYDEVKMDKIVSHYEGIISLFESLIESLQDLHKELQNLIINSQNHFVKTVLPEVDNVVYRLRLLSRSIMPIYLFIEKPGATYDPKFELTLQLIDHMEVNELEEVIFSMNLDHKLDFLNPNRVALAIAIVSHCDQNKLLPELLDLLAKERPQVNWKKPYRPKS